jgi:hypothetical protein
MGLEFNGHRWEWLEQCCRYCGMTRQMAFEESIACAGFIKELDIAWLMRAGLAEGEGE